MGDSISDAVPDWDVPESACSPVVDAIMLPDHYWGFLFAGLFKLPRPGARCSISDGACVDVSLSALCAVSEYAVIGGTVAIKAQNGLNVLR